MTNSELLMREFYEGSTIEEAKKFIENCYNSKVTERQIENAKKRIKKNLNIDWK